jgi:N-succinyldiaminopimelate aminotransferase
MDFCLALPDRAGVVAVPAGPFHDPTGDAYATGKRLVRWAFCKDRAVLEEALERLAAADLTPA